MTNEATYMAIVKLDKSMMPQRITYMAESVGQAIIQMVKLTKVKSTADIYEFEILEVVGRDKFKKVAMKLPNKPKPHINAASIAKAVSTTSSYEESVYKPYKLKVA